eukprot:CAMPEP_0175897652 /NCGR_PEP_ID=MMETSP0108-20121206/833_1 /TAXON_ID=195067 ORGANISM="Goniomonas pacifica, Strain CCMP1869" /NCGR_SAMPLE_ID=MMETSP0108 /ASSEMBLY_ACC=CAM_ASM_000204 /LENGTH=102 /DNA_ID=CAMNT_0017218963 /DNA_START=255 /DNA_END=563 /DNA_ORIENTATION=+
MATRLQRLGIAQPPNDEAPRPHGPRYDAELPSPSTNSTFARHPNVLSKVFLQFNVIVVAVDGDHACVKGRKVRALSECLENRRHHHFPVNSSIPLVAALHTM